MTRIHFSWREPAAWRNWSAAVALHGHTRFSRENLAFIPTYIRSTTWLGGAVRSFERHYRRVHGRALDFTDLWWTPPLPAREAFRIEYEQIEGGLQMRSLVSLTDHDEIAACALIRLLHGPDATPISLEWSVPLGESFVHLGVHNLPVSQAQNIFHELCAYTSAPRGVRLSELLAWINDDPGTMVVLNHPLWDEAHIGEAAHQRMIHDLLAAQKGRIHALELNGLRRWSENAATLALARALGLPAVAGGDRHGSEPSACLNLTHASSFTDFVDEVRRVGRSDVLFLARYADCCRMRQVEAAWDLIRDYPEYPGSVRWTDRTYLRDEHGVSRPLSALWPNGEPLPARACYQALRLFSHERMRPALRLAIARRQQEPAL